MTDEPFRPDIEEVFDFYGARILTGRGDWVKASCPLTRHDDQNPSASVNVEAGKWRCYSCDMAGDVYDILKENENLARFPELVAFAEANFERGDRGVRAEPVSRSGLSHGSRPGRRKAGPYVPPWKRT